MSKSNQTDNLIETDDEFPKLLSDCPMPNDLQPLTTENTAYLVDTHDNNIYFIIKSPCIVGRDRTVCDIVLPYDTVSRKHAKITEINGDYIIEDLGSKHSTTVGYRSFKQHNLKRMALIDGDTIKFADKEFIFKNPKQSKKKEKLGIYFSRELVVFLNGGEAIDVDDIDAFTYRYLEKFFDEVLKFDLLDKEGGGSIATAEYSTVSCWSSIQGNFDLVYYFDGDWDITCLYIYAVKNPITIFNLILKGLESHISKKLYANELLGDNFQISLTKERSLKEIHEEMKNGGKNNDL